MCLAVPARVESVEGLEAKVDMGGVARTVSIRLSPDTKQGDYVIVHTGYVINILDQQEALETLRLFEEMDRLGREIT